MILITFEGLRFMVNTWVDNPTVMFIENTESPIREIPFPSIHRVKFGNLFGRNIWPRITHIGNINQ